MATLTKRILSGSTTGLGIKVVQTATLGTTIHTAVTGTSDMDEIWLYAVNSDSTARKLTIEWGGATSPDCLIEYTVPAGDGLYFVAPRLLLYNARVSTAFFAKGKV